MHSEFPNFNAAVNRKDWTRAATESHRTGIGDSVTKTHTTSLLLQVINKKSRIMRLFYGFISVTPQGVVVFESIRQRRATAIVPPVA